MGVVKSKEFWIGAVVAVVVYTWVYPMVRGMISGGGN